MRSLFLTVLATTLLAGCGSNPGGGTRSLYVKAEAWSDGSTDGTWISVEVRDGSSNGTILNDATVSMHGNRSGDFNLPWEGVSFGNFRAGSYHKGSMAWDSGFQISVKRGNDALDGYLEVPGVTTIVNPLGGTTFRRADGQPLVVKWKDDVSHVAQKVTVTFDHADAANSILNQDPLQLPVDPNRLVAASPERVEVRRENTVNLAGGVAGSSFTGTTRHRIDFNVE